MHLKIPLVILFVFIAKISAHCDHCYHAKKNFSPNLGTRSAYELLHGKGLFRHKSIAKCKPLQIWMLARHGTKFLENKYKPAMLNLTKFRDQILENHENGDGNLCDRDLEILRDWKVDPNVNTNEDAPLAPQGKKDLLGLADRLKHDFPELFQITKNTKLYEEFFFQTTHSERTVHSMDWFIRGVVGNDTSNVNTHVRPDNDRLLIPHLNCPPWFEDLQENDLLRESRKFMAGPEVAKMLSKLTKNLGFQFTLDFTTVRNAYEACRYEVSWHPDKVSSWCTIFDRDDLKIFEYIEDLHYYYFEGPAHKLAATLGCPILSDMFERFKALESGKHDQPKGVFNFGHSTTMRLYTTALHVGKYPPFNAKSYATAGDRVFRTSKFGPFATNVVAIFYRCDEEKSKYKVSFHIAESPLPIEDCDEGICDWEFLKKKFGSSVENCNLDFCDKY